MYGMAEIHTWNITIDGKQLSCVRIISHAGIHIDKSYLTSICGIHSSSRIHCLLYIITFFLYLRMWLYNITYHHLLLNNTFDVSAKLFTVWFTETANYILDKGISLYAKFSLQSQIKVCIYFQGTRKCGTDMTEEVKQFNTMCKSLGLCRYSFIKSF